MVGGLSWLPHLLQQDCIRHMHLCATKATTKTLSSHSQHTLVRSKQLCVVPVIDACIQCNLAQSVASKRGFKTFVVVIVIFKTIRALI